MIMLELGLFQAPNHLFQSLSQEKLVVIVIGNIRLPI